MIEAFDHEIKMLLDLARYLPHDHILTHITSWEQDGVYYILYEKAHGNLREHMEEHEGGVLTAERTLWFFYQLRGMADAMRRIHFFREPDNDPFTGMPNLKKTGVIGRHHDIKPENILTFDLPRDLPTLKLSDFGAGKFSHMKNRSDSIPTASGTRFTRTYAGPESHQAMRDAGAKVTRPFDIWALGCVFSEFLLWFLGIKFPDGELRFEDMRMNKKYNSQREEYDFFWERNNVSGEFRLNKAVKHVLDMLQNERCKEMQPFQELIGLIRRMLMIKPTERIRALQLFNALDAIFVKAKAELDHSPTCYSNLHERNQGSNTVADEFSNPISNFLNVTRLEEDISITSESRAETQTKLKDLDTPTAVIPQLENQRTAEVALHESGSQFPTVNPHHGAQLSLSLHDGDAGHLSGSASRSSLLDHVDESFRQT